MSVFWFQGYDIGTLDKKTYMWPAIPLTVKWLVANPVRPNRAARRKAKHEQRAVR